MRRGDTVTLKVKKVVYGGRGLAHVNNMVIFIDNAVPDDRVLVQIMAVKKNFAEAKILELIEESPHRIIAPCPYNSYCGGCTWQCIKYTKQLEYKHTLLIELLTHIGKATDFAMNLPLASPLLFEYRNKMEFSFSEERCLLPNKRDGKKDNRRLALGLHVQGSFDKIIDIEGCLLQKEKGNKILREAKRYIRDSGIPAYTIKTHQGYWRSFILRHSYFFDEWMVNIITSEEKESPIYGLASILQDKFPEVISIVNNINTKRRGKEFDQWERIVAGERTIKDKIGRLTFQISANSFFQTNTAMAESLYRVVKDFASLTGKETILDLYCGIGTVSIFLAYQAKKIIGIDISNAAIADAKKNCNLNGIGNCEFLCGEVEIILPELNIQPDLLIIDPPRVGIQKRVIAQILSLLPGRIIYISCNPSTLARDIVLLKESYNLEQVQVVDLFPNTYHIESVARLERA